MDPRERFEDVIALYYDRIKRYLSLKIDAQSAEDLTQLTFIKAYENYHAFNSESTLFTWLFNIANNNLKNEYRRKYRNHKSIVEIEQYHTFVSFEFTENVELRIDISMALTCLNELDREIISLYYDGGFKLFEISEMVGLSLSAVKNRLYRALKKLNHQFHYDVGVNTAPSAAAFIHLVSADHSVGSDPAQKQAYQNIIDHMSLKVGQIFNLVKFKPSKKITIEIYENLQAFHLAVNEPNAPNWFMGVVEGNTIKITSPLQPGPEHTYESILKSVDHLFTICLVKEINPAAPKWIYQGLGGYQAELMTERYINKSIAQLVKQGLIPSLEDLSDNSWDFETKKGFQFSYTLVEFVLKQYGATFLNKLIRNPSDLENIFGCTASDFCHKWRESLVGRFRE